MLQWSFSFVAAQLLVKMTSELQKSECCRATSALQLSENCNATSVSLVACNLSRTLKSTQIRGVPKSDFSGSQKRGDKGGGEEGRSGGRVNRPWRGKRGEK